MLKEIIISIPGILSNTPLYYKAPVMEMDIYTGLNICHSFLPRYLFIWIPAAVL